MAGHQDRIGLTNSNDSNGTFDGTITSQVDGTTYTLNISGNYRYTQNSGPGTTISFTGGRSDNPNLREAWAGYTVQDGSSPSEWFLSGGRGVADQNSGSVTALSGTFQAS